MRHALGSFLLVFALCSSAPGAAGTATLNNEMPSTIEELKSEKTNFNKTEENRRALLSDLYKLNYRIKKVIRERGQFEFQRNQTHKRVAHLTSLVGQLEKKIEAQRVKLIGRLKALYKFGDQGVLRLAFSSENASDFNLGVQILKTVINSDYLLLKDYQRNVKDLTLQKDRLGKQAARLSSLEEKVKQKESELVVDQKGKSELLTKIDTNQVIRAAKLKMLKLQVSNPADAKQMKQLKAIEDLLAPSITERRGQLSLPINAPIERGFGDWRDPRLSQISIRHKGLSFKAIESSPTRTIFTGKVTFAGDLRGVGKTVVIDHGESYYSIYSNLGSVSVKAGDRVAAEQVIGQTKALTGLYFEVRHFSEAQDPALWLAQTSGELSPKAQ